MPVIDKAIYRKACNEYLGWCPTCEDFTRDCTEPDAEGYDCPECGGNDVSGAENAAMAGAFQVSSGHRETLHYEGY